MPPGRDEATSLLSDVIVVYVYQLRSSLRGPGMPGPYKLGYFSMTCAWPPAAAIFCAAEPLNLCACTVNFLARSPRPSTLMGAFATRTSPRSRSTSGVTHDPASKTSPSVSRFTTAYSTLNGLWNPRFGTRRCSGIWPPSKPRLNRKPERDLAPLVPRDAVLP